MANLEICQRNTFGYCKYNQQCQLTHEKKFVKAIHVKFHNAKKDTQKNVVGLEILTDAIFFNVPLNT